jgi:uncharacterized protein YndB with AHSA1/START domain
MNRSNILTPDPKLDLVLERVVDVPPELVWKAWTTPEHLKQWFTPRPWTTPHCEIDLRPGGRFRTVMRSPEGKESVNDGCYLEVIPGERLVWTNMLLEGYRPRPQIEREGCDDLPFTAVIAMERHPKGTLYRATAIHADETGKNKHAEMGFYDGWGTVLDQLVEWMKTR